METDAAYVSMFIFKSLFKHFMYLFIVGFELYIIKFLKC